MKSKEKILCPKKKLSGGTYIPHNKTTAEMNSAIIAPPKQVIIPMLQHIGVPCEPTVNVGDKVFVGTKIGDSDKFVSAPIHSSVSGEVAKLETIRLANGSETTSVIINSDGEMTPDSLISPKEITTPEELSEAAKACGLVGLGGAGFPTHVKLNISPDKPIDTLIVNGAECEPYITADYRECIENPNDILEGVNLIKKILGIKQAIICLENNKPGAIKLLFDMVSDKKYASDGIHIMKLKSKYPQGAEKVLIYSATGRKLPMGKLPGDVGCIVMNVTSVAALYRFIKTGMPLVSKRITIDGNAVSKPQNLIVPIGTPISHILEICEAKDYEKIILGGPMMGQSLFDIALPIMKQNNAVLAFKGIEAKPKPTTECIRCGRCLKACPVNLAPRNIEQAIAFGSSADELKRLNTMHCIECGSCSFICPAGRPLTASMRLAKNQIRKAGN